MPPRKRAVPNLAPLGNVFRAFREATGLSQETLAYDYGLDRSAVSAIERGRNITFTSMRATLVALGVTWEDFGKAMHQKDPIPPRKPLRRRA